MKRPLLSRGPLVTVVRHVDDAGEPRVAESDPLAGPRTRVVTGPLPAALAAAEGRWLLVLAPGAGVSRAWLDAVIDAASGRADAIVAVDSSDAEVVDADDDRRRALTDPAVLVRRALADGHVIADPLGADVALRAHAVAGAKRIERVAVGSAPAASPVARTGAHAPREAARVWLDVFAAIEAAVVRAPSLRKAALALKNRVATEIGRVVALDPGIRLDVLAEVEERGLRSFSARMVNVEAARDLAIVYGFPPFLDTGGFVVSRRFDAQPDAYDVLTQDMSRRRVRDDRSLELARRNLGRRMIVREPLATGNWEQVERFCRAGMAKIEEREADAGPYRSIYSRSMWIAPSVLGAWYKSRRPGTPWTAELSDPLAHRPNGELRPNPFPDNAILDEIRAAVAAAGRPGWHGDRFFEGVEWMVYALADRIVFTNENQRDFMLAAFPDREIAARALAVSEVDPHPVPRPELYEIGAPGFEPEPDRITIAYFGNFYGVRGVGDLLEPFAALTPGERSRLRLLVFTPSADDAEEAVREHLAADVVRVLPAEPYFDFLALTRRVDWLVLADAHSPAVFPRNPFLPSKLADYRGSGTPIWGIVEPGSVLSGQELDETSTLGDAEAGAAVLRRILTRTAR